MENQKIPQSNEVVGHEAEAFVAEHNRLTDMGEQATAFLAASTTREAININRNFVHRTDMDRKDHNRQAHAFAQDNLPQLKDMAMQEAIAAGKSIVHYEMPPGPQPHLFNIQKMRDDTERARRIGVTIDVETNARLKAAEAYCIAHDIDPRNIPKEDEARIKNLPEWKNT